MSVFTDIIHFYYFLTDNLSMEGYTITEMAVLLKINPDSVLKRLQRKGIKPKNREVIYDYSALEEIRNVPSKGRPKKQPEPVKAKKGKKQK